MSEATDATKFEIPVAFREARSLLPDTVVVIAWWDSLDSHEMTLQDYLHVDGRSFIPLFADKATFDAEPIGLPMEKSKLVGMKSDFLFSVLRGGERLVFKAKGCPPVWIDLPTL